MRLLTGPFPARITWGLLPLAMGPALESALEDRTHSVEQTTAVLAWGGWALVLVAVLIPRTMSLTVVRMAAPASVALANWAAITGPRDLADVIGVAWAALTVVAIFAPTTGDAFVNGSSYGDERRMPLRTPGSLLLGPIQLAWVAGVAAPMGVPLLIAADQMAPAIALLVVGAPAAVIATRALHGLSRRWVVFVPAGLVLHDLHAMVDPVLLPRSSIRRLGPAATGSQARDLTQGSLGLALEAELAQPTEIAPRRRDRSVQVEVVDGLLFSPTRPAAVLREAAGRRFAVAAPHAT